MIFKKNIFLSRGVGLLEINPYAFKQYFINRSLSPLNMRAWYQRLYTCKSFTCFKAYKPLEMCRACFRTYFSAVSKAFHRFFIKIWLIFYIKILKTQTLIMFFPHMLRHYIQMWTRDARGR